MNTYESMPDNSRVWIYQSDRPFEGEELNKINDQLSHFVHQWVSHNRALKAYGGLFHNQFVVLMVDESQAGASGCSIDSSVHFIKSLEAHFQVNFFDRMNFAFMQNEQVRTAQRDAFSNLYQNQEINDNTLVFNNLVKNKTEFESSWRVPLKDSWHARMV